MNQQPPIPECSDGALPMRSESPESLFYKPASSASLQPPSMTTSTTEMMIKTASSIKSIKMTDTSAKIFSGFDVPLHVSRDAISSRAISSNI